MIDNYGMFWTKSKTRYYKIYKYLHLKNFDRIKELENKIRDLESTTEDLTEKVDNLNDRVEELQGEIDEKWNVLNPLVEWKILCYGIKDKV